MKRTVDLRFLAWMLAGLILFTTGAYFVNAYQVKRNASALLDQGRQAKEQKELQRAARYYQRYLGFEPWNADALAEYGFTLEQMAQSPREHLKASKTFDEVLLRAPDRDDVRRSQAELVMKMGLFTDAIAHYGVLHDHARENGELLYLLAHAEERAGHHADAAKHYHEALEKNYRTIETYMQLAFLLRRHPPAQAGLEGLRHDTVGQKAGKPPSADDYAEQMVAQHRDSFRAHLALAGYHREFGPKDKVAGDLARAQALAPSEADVLLAVAELAGTDKADREQARKPLRKGIDLYPQDTRFHLALAELELRAGNVPEADRWLREATTFPPHTTQALWALGNMLLDAEDLPHARKVLDNLRKADPASSLVKYLEGRVLFREGKWYQATQFLTEARTKLIASKDLSKRASLFLGQCYERLGNPDLALSAYRQAVRADALWVPARLGLASAALSLNKTEAALEEYRALQETVPESGLAIARLLILRNLGLAPAARDWEHVDDVLKRVERALPDSLDARVLRAEVLVAQKKTKDASKLLEEAPDKQRQHAAYWVARAGLAERVGEVQKVLPLLDDGERRVGPDIEFQLARARYWAKQDKAQASAPLAALERGLDKQPAADQLRLRRALAQAHYFLGKTTEAGRLWGQVAEAGGQGNSLHVRLLLFGLALREGNDAKMRSLIAQIQDIEGPDGALWRYAEAARLVRRSEQGDRAGLPQAKQYLVEAAKNRPNWSRVPLLQATILEQEGDSEEAIKYYQQAVRQADRPPQAIRRLVQRLYEHRRFVEADEVLRGLSEETPISGDLVRLGAEMSLRNSDPGRALDLVQMTISAQGRDYRDLLWDGHMLAAANRLPAAEQRFREATRLGGQKPESWVAFVYFLARTGQKEKAEAVLAEAQAKLPVTERLLALAQCYEALGLSEKAAAQYQAALQAAPNDGNVLRAAAHYYLGVGSAQQAESYLGQLLTEAVKSSAEDRSWARRNLALVYAIQGEVENLGKALALMEENRQLKRDTPEDQRVRGIVLALHPGKQHEAIRSLEELDRRHALTPDEQLVLARLYGASGNGEAARSRLLSLATANGDNPKYLAPYVRSLLRAGHAEEARHWLERLEKIDAHSVRTVELKTNVLAKLGKVEEAVAAVKAYAAGKDGRPEVAAALLENLGRPAAREAEAAYRGLVEKSKRPENQLAYALFLGRQGRVEEALDLCERTLATAPPGAAARAAVRVLCAGKGNDGQARRVERWLTEALQKEPAPGLLLSLAELQDYRADYDGAAATYRRVLAKDQGNVFALNNLAWLLGVKLDQPAEALLHINRAVERIGPQPNLLDTRALIRLRMKDGGPAAAQDLEKVIAQAPSALAYFHLAQARWAAEDRSGAASALSNARAIGLTPESLHPLELAAYRELTAAVAEQ